jgi:hypothetical protein
MTGTSLTVHQKIVNAIVDPTDDNIDALLYDDSLVFRVDHREEDDAIVRYCESKLQTNSLAVSGYTDPIGTITLKYKDRTFEPPLTESPEDRHIMLWSLNEILKACSFAYQLMCSREAVP